MRKEVKIGLAVGGLLLVLLVIYLAFSDDEKTPNPDQVANKSQTQPSDPGGTAPGGTAGQDAGALPPGPGGTGNTGERPLGPLAGDEPGADGGLAEEPSADVGQPEVVDAASGHTSEDWEEVLYEDGSADGVLKTNTPDPRDPVPPPNADGATEPPAGADADPTEGFNDGGEAVEAGDTASDAGAAEEPTYTVMTGDNLYKISLLLYGRAGRVDEIYDLNRDVIGPDKGRLKVGTVLRLPDPPVNPQ